jgi:parallel beta-helix repeat protein
MAAARWTVRLVRVRLVRTRLARIGFSSAIVVAAGALGGSPAYAVPVTLYVGGSGCSDAGGGTASQPYCTISKAASVAVAGQTVQVAGGTYPERVSVANSGTAGSPIVFQAATGATVTVTGGTNGFAVPGRQYVTVSGFTVTGTSSYGIYVSGSSNIVISGNTVTHAGHPASGQIAAGIYLGSTTASTVSGNHTDQNSDHGIYLTSSTSGVTVSGNEASLNANGFQRNATGINVIGPNNTIIGNVTHDNEDSGIQFYPGGNNNLATLNVTYNNGDHGIDDLNVTGGRIIGNTVYHNCTSGINVEGTSGNYLVENNIAVDNAVYPAYNGISCNRRAGNIGIWDSAPGSTTVDANLVYLTKSGTMYVFGSSFSSLAAMKAATGQEQHGLQADPLFVDADEGNLAPQPGSPAIDSADSGASGEQPADINGNPRVDDPAVPNTGIGPRAYDDRGAYEFQPGGGGSPLPPTARLSVNPASGAVPLPVTADASGSTDPQGQALTFTVDFGDGTTVGPQSSPSATHTYLAAGSYTVTVQVTDTANLTATATAGVTVTAGGGSGGNPAYVNQIATNYSTTTHTSGYITVWRSQGVAAGHLGVLAVQLTGTAASGTVAATDAAGNQYTAAADVADATGDRLVVLSGVLTAALVPNDRITVSFPSAASYRITGDEVSGVTGPDKRAAAAGAGSTFASGSTGTTTSAPEFVFGTVAVFAGASPVWAAGWTALTTYQTGANYLGRAYRIPATVGSFNATGTAGGGWLATCVTFH